MHSRSEAFIHGYQDCEIYCQAWEKPQAKASLIITHGQGEHSECYVRVVEALKDLPINIYALDLRGHGRSEGSRGVVKDFDEYVFDLEAFFEFLKKEKQISKEPILMLGHSMGGLIQTKALLDHPEWNIKAQILSSPLFGLTKKVPVAKDLGAIALSMLAPNVTLWNEILPKDLTRDAEVLKEFEKDPYRHDRISSSCYLGFFKAQRSVQVRLKKLQTPTLMQISTKDPVISTEKAREYFDQFICEKKKLEYSSRKHEIYNDIEREVVLHDLVQFIESKI